MWVGFDKWQGGTNDWAGSTSEFREANVSLGVGFSYYHTSDEVSVWADVGTGRT